MDWLIFGSINIIIITIMFLILSRRLRRQYNATQFLAEVQQEVNAIVTELNHTTERNIQLLEGRVAQVHEILAELDRRILMAGSEVQKREQTDLTYNHLRDQRRAILRDLQTVEVRSAPVEVAIPETSVKAPPPVTAAVASPISIAPTLARALTRDAIKAQVVELAQAGMPATAIAQHAGLSLGEVELIISLHGSRST